MTSRTTLLSIPIDLLNREQVESRIRDMLREDQFHHIATVNPEFLVEADANEDFRKILNQTDLNVCDGAGLRVMGGMINQVNVPRITGVELAEMICRIASEEGKSVYFLGGFGVAGNAGKIMQKKYPNLQTAGSEDGNPEIVSAELKQAHPDIVLVAFGAPAQEYWLAKYGSEIPGLKLGIGIGGTFDFWTGKVRRAPLIMQKLGLEWLWRLMLQPKTRAKRIWNAVVVFPWKCLRSKKQSHSGLSGVQ